VAHRGTPLPRTMLPLILGCTLRRLKAPRFLDDIPTDT